jgi:hypothetical protein
MWLSKKEMKSNHPSFCEYLRRVDFQGAGGDENHSFHFDWPKLITIECVIARVCIFNETN